MKRYATANWKGTGKEGKGQISTQTTLLNQAPYEYGSRYEDHSGTNPEELIAAAHAGCFTMKLSFNISKAGFTPENIDTRCDITLDNEKNEITTSFLNVTAKVPGMSKQQFDEQVEDARVNCPVSKLLKAQISCEAKLE
jgi:lipoyl-dependent peroxiredoxin